MKKPQNTSFKAAMQNAGRYGLMMVFCFMLVTARVNAQIPGIKTIPTDVTITSDPDTQKITIEVNQGAEIANLLVLVVDNTGQTVFMDDRSHFKGIYKNQVDLTHKRKGEYDLKIVADKEEINKKLVIR